MLWQKITNTLKTKEQIENLGKDTDNIKKSKMEVLELTSTITNVKNSIDWLNCRVEGSEERTSGPENRK